MTSSLVFTRDGKPIKKPTPLNEGVVLIYAPRKLKFPCSEFTKYDTEIVIILPDNSRGFFCAKYKDNIEQFLCKQERLWIEILNKSVFEAVIHSFFISIKLISILKLRCLKK